MTKYQLFLLIALVLWPFFIMGLLFLMSRLEGYVGRMAADSPEEAGLEPVSGHAPEREVKIYLGDQPVGD